METDYLKLAAENQKRAREVIAESQIEQIWQRHGATVNLVGSLATGLLMKHRDIDFHVYTAAVPEVTVSFAAMAELAKNPRIKRVEFANLLDEEDACLEWHAFYEDRRGELWQLDLMHIRHGSKYDGYFEKVAAQIAGMLTDERRQAILRLKFATPDDVKIAGVEYYKAVIRDGIRNYADFEKWRAKKWDARQTIRSLTASMYDWIKKAKRYWMRMSHKKKSMRWRRYAGLFGNCGTT